MTSILVVDSSPATLTLSLVDLEKAEVIASGGRAMAATPAGGLAQALEELLLESLGGRAVDLVAHRVAHGGERFPDPVLLDELVLAGIELCAAFATPEVGANLAGIRAARERFPDRPQVAVFETSFHHTLPRRAALTPEPGTSAMSRRFGAHGPAHAAAAREAARSLARPLDRLRIVSLHLDETLSACAVEHGRSVDASEAIGIDGFPGAGQDLEEAEHLAAQGEDKARLAIAVLTHRLRKYVGGFAAAMGGLDAVVLSGRAAERGLATRQRLLQRLEFLGLVLDEDRNAAAKVVPGAPAALLSAGGSSVAALLAADRQLQLIAVQAAEVARGARGVKQPGPIPIAVSARHVHLTQEALELLFGPGAQLTRKSDLSQPGQFACHQTVNVIGPKRRIDGVRVLGPLRPRCQVEVSRTDEFHLGVDAPVRHSGHVQGSAPITLEGPKGTLHLQEGLICAWRHIHMSPDDARAHGVEDGDEVQVAVTGGERDLVFGDVVIRVHRDFRLEMHVDTDEANAAELAQKSEGELVGTGAIARLIARRPR